MKNFRFAFPAAAALTAGALLLTAPATPALADDRPEEGYAYEEDRERDEDHDDDDRLHRVAQNEDRDEDHDDDPFRRHLFEPEELLERSAALGLTPEQRTAMIDDVVAVQAAVSRMELEAAGEMGRLNDMLETDPIAEEAAVALARRLLTIEQETKLLYFGLLVRLRNSLKPEQQARFLELR